LNRSLRAVQKRPAHRMQRGRIEFILARLRL
jgi:hypothetical protein